jgi:Tfp pilus assembly protein PilX
MRTNINPAINRRHSERGAALATALIIMSLLAAVSMTVLAVVTHESRIAGSDLQRTQTFYASAAGIEKMTSDFGDLFTKTSKPTTAQLNNIAISYPTELTSEGFTFNQSLVTDPSQSGSTVTIPTGPFSGLVASVTPYILTSTATQSATGSSVSLRRQMNNYLIPIFQFGMFSNEDIELYPLPSMAINGRVHANGNIYASASTSMTFQAKVTTAGEFITDVWRNGTNLGGYYNVFMTVGAVNVPITMGSMVNGPNIVGATSTQRGYWPGSPNGTINSTWNTKSVAAAQSGVANQFGGQLLTGSTGAAPLLLPMQLEGNLTREILKRRLPNDNPDPANPTILSNSRYHSKAQIRILLDDETNTTDAAGIPAGQGVNLSTYDPQPLPNLALSSTPATNGGGRALWRILDNNTTFANSYNETSTSFVLQAQPSPSPAIQADTVRSPKAPPAAKAITSASNTNPIVITTSTAHGYSNGDVVYISGVLGANTNANGEYTIGSVTATTFALTGRAGNGSATANTGTVYKLMKSANGAVVPYGAGLSGHILIEVIDANGVARDVTREILSMGITEGEANSIVMLQRPLWAAFTQGQRDASASGGTNYLTYILNSTYIGADGEILIDSTHPTLDSTHGYMTNISDDGAGQAKRSDIPPSNAIATLISGTPGPNWTSWNAIVPINVYDVQEGCISNAMTQNVVYERGIMNVVQLNMRNVARWFDGIYDNNLLQGTNALSTNIAKPDGYTIYVSDRRGDNVRSFVASGTPVTATNGMADNEDIYGPNGTLDPGEDVQETGTLVKDTAELPDPVALSGTSGADFTSRVKRAISVAAWTNPNNYFRRSVRLFNGDNLMVTGAAGKLSSTLGITVSAENMVFIWGNYNTTGINVAPASGVACLNDPAATCHYIGNQVPASIVADAFSPMSKTWFDSSSAMYPDTSTSRLADLNLPNVAAETSVRAGIIAGNNLSALSGTPDQGNGYESRLNGGMINFPRFVEDWYTVQRRWNCVGSFIPLYHSTQAVGPWSYVSPFIIYQPPIRDWAFDVTFLDPTRLPPATPLFQHIEPTGFKQIL